MFLNEVFDFNFNNFEICKRFLISFYVIVMYVKKAVEIRIIGVMYKTLGSGMSIMEGESLFVGPTRVRSKNIPIFFTPADLPFPLYMTYTDRGIQLSTVYTRSNWTGILGSRRLALNHRCTTSSGTIANDRMQITYKFFLFIINYCCSQQNNIISNLKLSW